MSTTKVTSNHRCASCNRQLKYGWREVVDLETGATRKVKYGRWIKSRFTGSHYCYVGEGCNR